MKSYQRVTIVAGVLLAGAAIVGQFGFAIGVIIGWLALVAMMSIKGTASGRQEDPRDAMDADSRSLYSPIRRLTDEIESVVAANQESAIVSVVGAESITEARRIRDQLAKALVVRSELKKASRDRNMTKLQIEQLQARADASDLPAEKESLLSAIEARKLELNHYEEVDLAVTRIDSGVNQAQAALAEMKAKLAVRASSEKATAVDEEEDVREMIGRMKSLSVSVDEAEELLKS